VTPLTRTPLTRTDESDTMRDRDAASRFVAGIAFPAARADLLLHAIVTHSTPRLIGELRALPDVVFTDADSVVDALHGM
jgi:hypothetical protein